MTFIVPSVVEVLMNKIALWISIRANDWTVGSAIISSNKKVLLRERKRHTACRVVSTPSVVLTGYPPPLPAGPGRVRPPPSVCPMAFWEMLQSIMGYGYPPRCGQTNKVKLLPSRRTTYAGGNETI